MSNRIRRGFGVFRRGGRYRGGLGGEVDEETGFVSLVRIAAYELREAEKE